MNRAPEASRSHPERAVEEAVYLELLGFVDVDVEIHRQYRGWKRPNSKRPALIPDFLVVRGDSVLIIEVKAGHASPKDGLQVLRYMDRAASEGFQDIQGMLAARSFSPRIPPEIARWTI